MDFKLNMISLVLFVGLMLFSPIYGQVSVSGLSSGGFAAVQYHVIYSSSLQGCGVIAGGPFYCANGNLVTALTACMVDPELISIDELQFATSYAYEFGSIDDPTNLQNQKVWLYSGTQDSVVVPGVVQKLQQYYQLYVNSENIATEFNISSEHSFVTNNWGNACNYLGTPFINNCDFDSAGSILQHIYGALNPPVSNYSTSNVMSIDQTNFIPSGYSSESAGLQSSGYYYLPSSECKNGCKLHITFHGCEQTVQDINMDYVEKTGYNNWAEANDIIILYPEAMATMLNPKGCWDWWGYTGIDYCTQDAPQMATVYNMVQYLVQKYNVH